MKKYKDFAGLSGIFVWSRTDTETLNLLESQGRKIIFVQPWKKQIANQQNNKDSSTSDVQTICHTGTRGLRWGGFVSFVEFEHLSTVLKCAVYTIPK
jgi:hypothetical protein